MCYLLSYGLVRNFALAPESFSSLHETNVVVFLNVVQENAEKATNILFKKK